jgi:hypothetical protein
VEVLSTQLRSGVFTPRLEGRVGLGFNEHV